MPKVAIIMGSKTDWEYMKEAAELLKQFDVEVEVKVVSAHRTPEFMFDYAKSAFERGIEVIIAGAGGAAHLPGMTASLTHLPVIGVPIPSKFLNGLDSLLSIVQMPFGTPVATVAIGNARNAALLALRILGIKYPWIAERVRKFVEEMRDDVLSSRLE
ncbi:MAG: 5-(carboxyamino)imidazole ribonucleotide mutase [Sulfolobales archaeon]|nr:5-(carboxyamino)imidazole ribonucleotide mutase [Sulfolobales archaeon]MCX8186351.1 5-(carboxyamino)imidazole ribonucleotide mutase [Sulfolobales archaeon]MDW7968913.1 5-(carboxyamino)imidazole ribonucleotide mutase [Sulfolobales archaeon]